MDWSEKFEAQTKSKPLKCPSRDPISKAKARIPTVSSKYDKFYSTCHPLFPPPFNSVINAGDRLLLTRSTKRLRLRRSFLSLQIKMDDPPPDWSYHPWSNPEKDILLLIFDRLKDPLDLLNCSGVCSSWYSVVSESLSNNLKNLPPLILFSNTIQRNLGSGNITNDKGIVFYNCQSRNDRRFPLPAELAELSGSWVSGSSHGWMISIHRKKPRQIFLINAISYAQIRLPNANGVRWMNKLRIILSANPTSNPNCMILAIYPFEQHFAFCRLGDSSWIKIENDNVSTFSSATFYKGKFHVYYCNEQMLQIDPSKVPEIVTRQTRGLSEDILEIDRERERGINKDRNDYLMESMGDLLLVSKYTTHGKIAFKVHKFDDQESEWIEVTDLGNRALFVGYNNSLSVISEADDEEEEEEDARRYGGFRGNCIYFIDDSDTHVENQMNSSYSKRGLYDMNVHEFKGWIPGIRPVWFNSPLSWIRPEV